MAELRAFEPSWRDRLAGWMMGNERATPERRRFVEGLLGSSGLGNTGFGVVDATPVGGLLAAQESAKEGDYRGAAMNAMFLGAGARTANKAALKAAEEMATKGATREAIWNETGWFKGPDNNWRFEIPDHQAKIGTKAADDLFGADGNKAETIKSNIPGVLWHDELYKAYPELRRVQATVTRDPTIGSGGSFTPIPGKPTIEASGDSLYKLRSTLLHEMQHGVQEAERFAPGANWNFGWKPQEIDNRARMLYERPPVKSSPELEELAAALEGLAPKRDTSVPWDQLPIKERVKWYEDARNSLYTDTAGEVEARNVQKRMDMTPDQRRATPPWATQDVPDELQIIRGLLGD